MRSILLAFSFVRVPKLFVALLLWPLVIGLLVAGAQIFSSSLYLGIVNETPAQFERRIMAENPGDSWLRKQLFGTDERFSSLLYCRWEMRGSSEVPPSELCAAKNLDIALQVQSPALFDAKTYADFFNGSTRAMHLCRSCRTDITIAHADQEKPETEISSLAALGVYMLAESDSDKDIKTHFVRAKESAEENKDLGGIVYLQTQGLSKKVNITDASSVMILVINTTFLLLVTVWLALRGHKKVLDYFVRNNALLPLVAACGKDTFYTSLWIVSLIRVAFFLLASLPATYLAFRFAVPDHTLRLFIGEPSEFILWVAGIISSLCAVTIIASMAELKHRHFWASFLYKYLPLVLWAAGTSVWAATILIGSHHAAFIQNTIASLPVFGFSPLVLWPVFKLTTHALALHVLLSSALVFAILRRNSRWFAAHLEEL